MGDWGMKASQKNFPVDTCADHQLLFSSSWPLLKIAASGAFTINDATQDVVIATHNLGYVPLFWVFNTNTWFDDQNGGSQFATTGVNQYIGMNETDLKWQGATRGAPGGTYTGYYYIFRLDLETAFSAPVISTNVSLAELGQGFGIKVSKEGESIDSTDMRDFALHSSTRSPHIHMVGNGSFPIGGGSVEVTHALGYQPLFFFFARLPDFGDDRWQMALSSDESFVQADTTTAFFGTVYECDFAYIVLKDPFEDL